MKRTTDFCHITNGDFPRCVNFSGIFDEIRCHEDKVAVLYDDHAFKPREDTSVTRYNAARFSWIISTTGQRVDKLNKYRL